MAVAKFPRFTSPVARERRAYFRALQQWFQTGSGPPVQAPEDPLRPYCDAHPGGRRKLISLPVDEDLLELTRGVARQHGLRYQAVIRLWIADGLRRALVCWESKTPTPPPWFLGSESE